MNPTVAHGTYPKRELLIRMERNNKMFQRLSQKLNSYTCEPKCSSGFEHFIDLKRDFKNFARRQKELMGRIEDIKNGIPDGLAKDIRSHLDRFNDLEYAISEYLVERDMCL